MTNFSELKELTRMRVLLFLREPEAVFWVIVFPLLLAIVLGWAFQESETEPAIVGIHSSKPQAELPQWTQLHAEPHVELKWLPDLEEAQRDLVFGNVAILVMLDSDPPLLRYDPQRPEAAMAKLRVERSLFVDASERETLKTELIEETGSRYIDWLFPGLLGMNLMGTGIWGIGFAIADMRQKKLLRRFLVTPMRRSSFMLSFILSRGVFLTMEVAILVLFATLVLGVPLRGSVLGFGVLCITGAITFAAIGILIASRARTIEGVSGLMNLVMMPMWLFSGVFFSYERFPEAVQPIIKLLPLTALNDGLRTVMIEGTPVFDLWPIVLVQVTWALVTFAIGLKVFRWE